MRKEQSMTIDQIYDSYTADLDRCGYLLDDEFIKSRGLTEKTRVRFTTDSSDRFDAESFNEIQAG